MPVLEEMDRVETESGGNTAILSLLAQCETKVNDILFDESDEAQQHLSKLMKLFNHKISGTSCVALCLQRLRSQRQ